MTFPSSRDKGQGLGLGLGQIEEDREGEGEDPVCVPALASSSYNWMVNTLSFFLREVWTLIQGDALHPLKGSADRKKDAFSYSRADLCEVRHIASYLTVSSSLIPFYILLY